MNTDTLEIQISRAKLKRGLITGIIFFLLGCWILIDPPSPGFGILTNTSVVRVIMIICIVLFGLGTIYYLKKMKDKRPGLIIDQTGITDHSSGVAAGHIPWEDINRITYKKVFKQEFIMIIVKNPEDYLERQTNMLKRISMKMNFKSYGSPISIPIDHLKYDRGELKIILEHRLATFKEFH
jgi:hypothetical protein